MSEGMKLPVFDTIGEVFGFAFRKIVPVFILNLTTAILILLPLGILMFLFLWTPIQGMAKNPPADPERSTEFILFIVPFMLIVAVAVFAFYAVLIQRITRNVIANESIWLFRINRNTFQVFSGLVVTIVISSTIAIGAVLFVQFGAEAVSANLQEGAKEAVEAGITVLAIFAAIYFVIRFSLIPTAIAAENKFSFSDGYRATRGNVIRLFLINLFVAVATFLISIIAQLALSPLLAIDGMMMGLPNAAPGGPGADLDFTLLQEIYTSTGFLIYWALLMVVQAFQLGLGLGISAIAYGKLTGKLAVQSHSENLGSVELG